MDTEKILIEFIKSEFMIEQQTSQLPIEQPLLNDVIDSVGLMRLVVFIEEKFNLTVQDEDLVPENFQNIKKISEYIRTKI